MGVPYNLEQLTKKYNEFCGSVNECLDKLDNPELPEEFRDILERRVKVTFMIADFSLSAFDSYSDVVLNRMREGVNDLRMKWGHYRTSHFRMPFGELNNLYSKFSDEELLDSTLP